MGKQEILLRAIAACGELPCGMAEYILGSKSYTAALITRMKKEGLIGLRWKDGLRGYVLCAKGRKELLIKTGAEYRTLLAAMENVAHTQKEPQKRLRLHRVAKAWAYFYRMGVCVFPSEKSAFLSEKRVYRCEGSGQNYSLGNSDPGGDWNSDCKNNGWGDDHDGSPHSKKDTDAVTAYGSAYYTAFEFKNGNEQLRSFRACGMLFIHGQAAVVYHTLDRRMRWARKTERTMQGFAEQASARCGYQETVDMEMSPRTAWRQDAPPYLKNAARLGGAAVMIGDDMDVLLSLLESDGGHKGDLFTLDDVYEYYYYFSMKDDGKAQMLAAFDTEASGCLRNILSQTFDKGREREYALADGYDEDGTPVYFCYDLEMHRLARIKQELFVQGAGKFICLDYQAETLKKYFGEEAEALPLLPGKVMELLGGAAGAARGMRP
ncbi:MAG: hypothetical protein LUF27_01275 [Lachnospiraceae bacterium]|nr:hypothetical protein [Lachnospiraceae bacterium]